MSARRARQRQKDHELLRELMEDEFPGEYVRVADVKKAVGAGNLRHIDPHRYGLIRSDGYGEWTTDLLTALRRHRDRHDSMKRELEQLRTGYRMLHAALMDEKRRNLA